MVQIPWQCWEVEGFKWVHDECLKKCQRVAAGFVRGETVVEGISLELSDCEPGMPQSQCEQLLFDGCIRDAIEQCKTRLPPEVVAEIEGRKPASLGFGLGIIGVLALAIIITGKVAK